MYHTFGMRPSKTHWFLLTCKITFSNVFTIWHLFLQLKSEIFECIKDLINFLNKSSTCLSDLLNFQLQPLNVDSKVMVFVRTSFKFRKSVTNVSHFQHATCKNSLVFIDFQTHLFECIFNVECFFS